MFMLSSSDCAVTCTYTWPDQSKERDLPKTFKECIGGVVPPNGESPIVSSREFFPLCDSDSQAMGHVRKRGDCRDWYAELYQGRISPLGSSASTIDVVYRYRA
jgi:hypothetical protein